MTADRAERSVAAAALVALVGLGVLPLIRLVVLATSAVDSGTLAQVFGTDRTLGLFGRSVGIALGATLFAVLTGGSIGVVLARVAGAPRRAILLVLFVTFGISPYVLALGWLGGRLDSTFAGVLLGKPVAVAGVLGAGLMPLATLLSYGATRMRSVGSDAAAFVVAGPLRAIGRVVLPASAPVLVLIAAVTFSLALSDYAVASLYQVPTYPIEVFLYYAGVFQPALAARASMPLLLCGLAVSAVVGIVVPRILLRREPLDARRSWPLTRSCGLALVAGCAIVLLLVIGPPIIRLLAATGGAATVSRAVKSGLPAAYNSLWISIVASLVSVALAWPASVPVARARRFTKTVLCALMLLPLFVPASAYGIAWVETMAALGARITGSASPIVCLAARLGGVTCLFLAVIRSALPSEPLDAARLQEPRPLRRWLVIDAPLLGPALLGVLGVLVALNLNATSILVLTVPAGREVLPIRTDNLLHYGLPEEATALTLVSALLTATSMLVGLGAYRMASRRLWTH